LFVLFLFVIYKQKRPPFVNLRVRARPQQHFAAALLHTFCGVSPEFQQRQPPGDSLRSWKGHWVWTSECAPFSCAFLRSAGERVFGCNSIHLVSLPPKRDPFQRRATVLTLYHMVARCAFLRSVPKRAYYFCVQEEIKGNYEVRL
jgi:hypothetical protein